MNHEELIGKPWEANAQGPDSFDCWGLVRFWSETNLGVTLPKTPVDSNDLKAVIGGLGAFKRDSSMWEEQPLGAEGQVVAMGLNERISHVGIHIGDGFVLHCSRGPGMVVIQTIPQLNRQWGTLKIYQFKG